ncbi:MAG: type II secretion system major pseudopilin GspG [Planctomycetota bacterium]
MHPRIPRRAPNAGFSLAELMVVIVIIGLLAAVVVPNVLQRLGRAQVGSAKAQITIFESSLNEYAIQNGGRFPDSLDALVEKDASGNSYIEADKVPMDPWGHEYFFEPPNPGNSRFRVGSYGADGEPGGEGDALDIDNIMIKNGEI